MAITQQQSDLQKKMEQDLLALSQPNLSNPNQPATPGSEATTAAGTPATATQAPSTTPASAAPAPAQNPQVAFGGQTMAAPPPPPPPAAPILDNQLQNFASDWMSEPNRFMGDYATAAREASSARLKEQEQAARRSLDELISSRGLVGSNIEADAMANLQNALVRGASADDAALLEKLASYEAQDRLAAGEYGLDVAKYGQEGNQFEQNLQHELAMQGNEINQRESEFARSFGLDEQQFGAQQEQFSKTYSEDVASRLQNNEQFYAALQSDEARFATETGLRTRALDLQQQGMTMDDAYRQAALEQERDLTLSAQDLQQQGMQLDNAYRYAALNQDSTFRQRALDLQQEGMQLDEAYRQAELEFRDRQATAQNEAARAAILVQLVDALGGVNGLGIDTADLVNAIKGGSVGTLPTSTTGGGYSGGGGGGGGDGTDVPQGGGGTDMTSGWGPNGDMSYEEWLQYSANRGD